MEKGSFQRCPFSERLWRILENSKLLEFLESPQSSGNRKGGLSKGAFAQNRLSYREMDCPVRWSLATPSALESQPRAEQGSVVANPICKCRRHKAGHLQVRVAVGRRSTCVLKETPLNKGPLGFPQECGKQGRIRPFLNQGALKGTNLRGQTDPKRRFSQIFADFH